MEAAEWFAEERARLSQIGRPPSYPDGQIAAIAATNDLILVTRNTTDFADFIDLQVENWFYD
jgi:tRNA(fMet)-specific endonuclease VapC